ncbi:MAG TPA: glycoside hydrolase family 88 protein [Thermoleophilaceae bacterium]|nr:glycoside hydrolase family 88 protein [Thermoleophilaceae bacterium]
MGRSAGLLVVACLMVASLPASAQADPLDALVANDLQYAGQQLQAAVNVTPVARYPYETPSPSGPWTTSDAAWWTSGFFPGSLWLMYQATGDPKWRTEAAARQAGLASQASNTSTHDVGFMLFTTYGNGYRLTGDPSYRDVVLQAAGSLATRYNPTVGATRSWNNDAGNPSSYFKVIIDNMMNLDLLFWGAQNGGNAAWTNMAVTHALTTQRTHVRADGSTFQLVVFNAGTGAVISSGTVQGYRNDSTWARGQAWAVHGFTQAYAYTGDARMLTTARSAADYFVGHLPADGVPYYDFQAPATDRPRDSSAAAIAASGLLWLARIEPDGCRAQTYLDAAKRTLTSLSAPPYLSQGTAGAASILLHATAQHQQGDVDNGLVYADYYFLEALLRYRDIASGVTPLGAPTCAAAPVLSVSPTSLSFAATQGAAGPAAQTLSVVNTGGGSLPFTASASAPWLTVSASSAAAPATLTVTASQAGLAPGTYNATVTVDGGGASGSPRSVPVTFTVAAAPPPPPPPPPPPTVLLGTASLQPNRDGVGAGTASAFRTVATATGSMGKLKVYLDSANRATRLVAGVYANAGGHPGRLLTQATLTSVTSGAWNALTVAKANIAAGTTYWIAVLSPSGRGTLQIRDRSGGGRSETSSQSTLSTLPQTWATGRTWPDGPLSATGGP